MAKSLEEMKAAMIAGMAEKAGKSLEEWLAIVRARKLSKHNQFVKLLKEEHGLTHSFSNMIALQPLQPDSHTARDTGTIVDTQYAGAKAGLRPLYDKLLAAIQSFGNNIEVSPKKAYVSLRRNKQFAVLRPSTATRLDVGINLKSTEATDRLEASGSFNAMVSHCVRLSKPVEMDKELLGWLKQAYERS